jgi:hypothetical protein
VRAPSPPPLLLAKGVLREAERGCTRRWAGSTVDHTVHVCTALCAHALL